MLRSRRYAIDFYISLTTSRKSNFVIQHRKVPQNVCNANTISTISTQFCKLERYVFYQLEFSRHSKCSRSIYSVDCEIAIGFQNSKVAIKVVPRNKVEISRPLLLELKRVSSRIGEQCAPSQILYFNFLRTRLRSVIFRDDVYDDSRSVSSRMISYSNRGIACNTMRNSYER